jgi:hypothetical protein
MIELWTATYIYLSGHRTEDVGTYSSKAQCITEVDKLFATGQYGKKPQIDCHVAGKNYYEGVERMMKSHGMASPMPPMEHK